MRRIIDLTVLLCLIACFTCSCRNDPVPTFISTEPNTSAEGTLTEETPMKSNEPTGKPTLTPAVTPTSPTVPVTTEKSFDMTLSGGGTSAVWWWDRGKAGKALRGEYLDFLEKNSINEIYICWPNFNPEHLASFVLSAGERGMKVSLLSGDASWIYPDNKGAESLISQFLEYQKNATPETRLASLHLDVEPHQLEAFYTNRDQFLQYYGDFVLKVSDAVRSEGEKLEWDIPFWFDDYTVTNENGEKEDILELLARNSDTLCLMSYRDTAEAVLECSEKEIALGKKYGCKIVLGVETHSSEGDHVSFMEEGKEKMYRECEKIYEELSKRLDDGNYGIAVHYLDTWYKLKD